MHTLFSIGFSYVETVAAAPECGQTGFARHRRPTGG